MIKSRDGLATQSYIERRLSAQTREFVLTRKEPDPVFTFQVGWSDGYDALFEGEYSRVVGIETIISNALKAGRVLLSGRGGGAKSTIILRLIRSALDIGDIVPVLIDLKSWQAEHYLEWETLQSGWISRFAMLLERFGRPEVDLSTLDALDPAVSRLVFIDGVNEVNSTVAQEIISVADDYAQKAIRTSVVLSDRIVRRELRNWKRWTFASVQPLTGMEILRVLTESSAGVQAWERADEGTKALLEVPFFLNQFLGAGAAAVPSFTKSSMIRSYFDSHVGLDEGEFLRTARAAFEVYRDDQSRTFPLQQFQEVAGQSATSKMQAAGVLRGVPDACYLSHHLYHDYLASCYLVSDVSKWNRDSFDTLTFSASSFDAVAMAIEQILDTATADLFVRCLYDWNAYSAAYSVAEATQTGSRISDHMLCIVLSVLAERRWDVIKGTAQQAEDALRLFPSRIHREFTQAADLEQVFQIVEGRRYEVPEFMSWRRLFTKRTNEKASADEIELITAADSVIGWTVANVLKRCKVSTAQQSRLLDISRTASPTVRWRIAHAIGSHPSSINMEFLVSLIESDEDRWVRYGAVRSLLEMAALGSMTLRERIFAVLRTRINRLSLDGKIQGQLRRSLFIRKEKAPPDWARLAFGVMTLLYDSAATPKDRSRLEQQALDVKREYEHSTDNCG